MAKSIKLTKLTPNRDKAITFDPQTGYKIANRIQDSGYGACQVWLISSKSCIIQLGATYVESYDYEGL